jgi:hypothetical protein
MLWWLRKATAENRLSGAAAQRHILISSSPLLLPGNSLLYFHVIKIPYILKRLEGYTFL